MTKPNGGSDAFGLTPDTRAYVPRAATEWALAELVAGARSGGAPVAIVGAAGVGKTLLLHLLGEQAGPGLQSVYLPNPRLAPEEICTWIAHSLGAPSGEDSMALLRAFLEHLREKEEACLLLVDDADAIPEATARWLGRLVADSRGALRLALAALDAPGTDRILRAFGEVRRVELAAEMSADETAAYVGWQLHRAGAPDSVRARFDANAMAALHDLARGNPRRLNLAVETLVRRGDAAVLEDEIAAHAERLAESGAPGAQAPALASPEPEAEPLEPPGAPARRSPSLASVLIAAGAVLAFALLTLRDAPAPETPSAEDSAVAPAPAPAPAVAPPPAGARVAVDVNASPWARIEIDGVDVGETPLGGIPLRPGTHSFRALFPDGRVVERSVEIDADRRHVVLE